ncbi:MFS transporter [Amycolatopsis sp. NPDC003865]
MTTTPRSTDAAAGVSPPDAPEEPRNLGLALIVIAAATLLIMLDASIVNVALPTIQASLGFSTEHLEWVVTAYSVAFGGLLLLGGRTGDLFGRRRMFMVGIAVFTLASFAGGFAMNQPWLIAARAVQGVGAAIAAPTALSLIATTFPEGARRNKAMGVYAIVSSGGAVLGFILGGVLTDIATWRSVLFVVVPIGILVLLAAPKVLPESSHRAGKLDLPGAVTVTAGMALLVYGLIQASATSWSSTSTWVPLAVAVVLLAAFVVIESKVAAPLLPLRVLAGHNRSAAYAITLAVGVGLFGVTFFLTLFLQKILGFGAIGAGLAFLPIAVAIGFMASTMGRLAAKIGIRIGVITGPLVAGIGALGLWLTTSADGSYGWVVGPMILLGCGIGIAIVPLTLTAITSVQPMEAGIASALVSVSQQVGGAIGLAVLGTVAITTTRGRIGGDTSAHHVAEATVAGYQNAFLVAGCVLIAAFLLGLVAVKAKPKPKTPAGAAS